MKKVSKSKLKVKMFELLNEVETSGETLVVTDFSRPVLKIIPYRVKQTVDEAFASWRDGVYLPDISVLSISSKE